MAKSLIQFVLISMVDVSFALCCVKMIAETFLVVGISILNCKLLFVSMCSAYWFFDFHKDKFFSIIYRERDEDVVSSNVNKLS